MWEDILINLISSVHMYVLKYTNTYYIFDLKPIVVSLIISNDNQFIRITLGLNVNACKMNNNNAIYVIICQKNVNSGMVEGFLSSCVYIYVVSLQVHHWGSVIRIFQILKLCTKQVFKLCKFFFFCICMRLLRNLDFGYWTAIMTKDWSFLNRFMTSFVLPRPKKKKSC